MSSEKKADNAHFEERFIALSHMVSKNYTKRGMLKLKALLNKARAAGIEV